MVKGDVTATETRNGGGFVDTSQASDSLLLPPQTKTGLRGGGDSDSVLVKPCSVSLGP